jgi:hypothetical protein
MPRAGDSIGRSITTRSTAGTSTPSLKVSTTHRASSSPRASWARHSARSAGARRREHGLDADGLLGEPAARVARVLDGAAEDEGAGARVVLPGAPEALHAALGLDGRRQDAPRNFDFSFSLKRMTSYDASRSSAEDGRGDQERGRANRGP